MHLAVGQPGLAAPQTKQDFSRNTLRRQCNIVIERQTVPGGAGGPQRENFTSAHGSNRVVLPDPANHRKAYGGRKAG